MQAGEGDMASAGLWGWETPVKEKEEADAKWGQPSFVYIAGSTSALKPRFFQLLPLLEPCGGDPRLFWHVS